MRHVVMSTDSIWVVPAWLAERDVRAGCLMRLPFSEPQRSSIAVLLIGLQGYEFSPSASHVVSYLRREPLFANT